MTNFEGKEELKYDLEERTAKFGIQIIEFCKSIQPNHLNQIILNQLLRAGTSPGANYCEANNASSRRDFKNKIFICKKEIQETKYWLRMIVQVNPEATDRARKLWREAHELNLIFAKSIHTMESKDKIKS